MLRILPLVLSWMALGVLATTPVPSEITADNSVLLANVLGHKETFESAAATPICFIKILSLEAAKEEDGFVYKYHVQGCETTEFRGFGVCTTADCVVRHYQVELFAPNRASTGIIQNVSPLIAYS
ncbi:hypothetical protein Poli38472_009564 [Pythium oligandrum]|uniref:Uncharacterized protein n=1 Tax=Pythium oligandrum TaxID=41045 RepID=A0A8K1FGW0_PYTOL|nr:hypothetical protein Poli38472_009564 [Pythium oligandrum]|eukprot:TMW62071.1 hypothetical protein Poli38472_009564 [Pythium oligandrum]